MVLTHQKCLLRCSGTSRRNAAPEPRERKEAQPSGHGRHHTVCEAAFVPLVFLASFASPGLPSCPIGRRKQQLLPGGEAKMELPRKPFVAQKRPTSENRLSGTLQRTELGVCPPLCACIEGSAHKPADQQFRVFKEGSKRPPMDPIRSL